MPIPFLPHCPSFVLFYTWQRTLARMPPKRSSKPALSDEEKMLLKEQQAQAAVLEQQRRAEMATKFLKVAHRV